MALTPEIRSTQAGVLAAVEGNDIRVTQAHILTAINFPTEQVRVTQGRVISALAYGNNIRVTQARVLVAVRGRINNPRLRAWTYTLDGHDMYVLRLGDEETLVFDTYSGQWSTYTSGDENYWRANCGITWVGADAVAQNYGSSVLVGDDTYGRLWILDPEQGYDDDPRDNQDDPVAFSRVAMGQVVLTGREVVPCYEVFLDCDVGAPSLSGSDITLSTSDDAGHTFTSQGTVTLTTDNFDQDVFWSSLGQMRSPGRLFKIEDDGAVTTIYGLELRNGG